MPLEAFIENCCGCCPSLIAIEGNNVGIDHSIRPNLGIGWYSEIYWGQDMEAGTYQIAYCDGGIFGLYQTGGLNVFYVTNARIDWAGVPFPHPPDTDHGQNWFFRAVYRGPGGVEATKVFANDPYPPSVNLGQWGVLDGYGYVQGCECDPPVNSEAEAIAMAEGVAATLGYIKIEHTGGPIGIRAFLPGYGVGAFFVPPGSTPPTFALFGPL